MCENVFADQSAQLEAELKPELH